MICAVLLLKALPIKQGKIVMSSKVKKEQVKTSILDSLVYWLVQVAFAVFTAAGLYHYLEPVDPMLSLPITVIFVGLLFYVSIRNR